MILEALKPLFESGMLSESTKVEINEAWEAKLKETRADLRSEIRAEFATRYDHDKKVMVEALDKMVSETLGRELRQVVKEKNASVKDRVRTVENMKSLSKKFSKFMAESLAKEIKEFREDKARQKKATLQLENFVMKNLAKELNEFAIDKRDLAATKVKLISEADSKLTDLKKKFIARSTRLVKESVNKQLKNELSQLREDIAASKQNSFGRKIFEAYATEFAATHLNEKAEVRKLNKQLAEAKKTIQSKATLLESTKKQLTQVSENTKRSQIMNELLSPLNKEKGATMQQLLENVQTVNLKTAYNKYLPAVLQNKTAKRASLTESRTEVTGDRTAKTQPDEDTNIIDIRRLAGI